MLDSGNASDPMKAAIDSEENEIAILTFMQETDCESYQEAKLYLENANFNQQEAVAKFHLEKNIRYQTQFSESTGSLQGIKEPTQPSKSQLGPKQNRNHNHSSVTIELSPEQSSILQQRLQSKGSSLQLSSNEGAQTCFSKLCQSFRCFRQIRKAFKKQKDKLVKGEGERIFYFNDLYSKELSENANFIQEESLVEPYELRNMEDNHKMQCIKAKASLKPIFAIVSGNSSSPTVQELLRNKEFMRFISENFEVLLVTISELKDLNLSLRHTLRRTIKKVPTAIIYMKNYYDLEDTLLRLEGQEISDRLNLPLMKESLQQVEGLCRKWRYLLQLESRARENIPLDQIATFYSANEDAYYSSESDDEETVSRISNVEGSTLSDVQSKQSLIKEQTQIYEEMAAQENIRKKSLDQQLRELEDRRQERQVRRLSLPEEPSPNNEDAVEFRFRCPVSGRFYSRSFTSDEKVDILYQYVDTNDEIEFETDLNGAEDRKFELFTSYPPVPLSEKREELIRDIFDQKKENILIREV